MNTTQVEVIIVGAGHAGLSASYYLTQRRIDHLIFERGQIGESWASQRWASFMMNTANKLNELPGAAFWGNDPDGFSSAGEFVASLKHYVAVHHLPVVEKCRVLSIEKTGASNDFTITISQDSRFRQYVCRQVILASGATNERSVPAFAGAISPAIGQLHASDYRHAGQLPGGAVLVVGGAQSGCQIAEDLADAGRTVYLSTSRVARIPRRYRGKDIMDWLISLGFFTMRAEDVPNPAMLHMPAPQLTGTGGGQRTISLQSLAQKGVILLGKAETVEGQTLHLRPNAPEHVTFADEFSKQAKSMINGFIATKQLTAPSPETDPDDEPDTAADCASSITTLNLTEQGIASVIWATGFRSDFYYAHLPILDNDGNPIHQQGQSTVEGLYFLGLPWLRNRKSSLLSGIKDDAQFIAECVYAYSQQDAAASIPNGKWTNG